MQPWVDPQIKYQLPTKSILALWLGTPCRQENNQFELWLIIMLVVILFGAVLAASLDTPSSETPKGNYYAGHMTFREDSPSAVADMPMLPLPLLVLSVSRLQYHTPFDMTIFRSMDLMSTGNVRLKINTSLSSLDSSKMYYTMVVSYLFTQSINYF